MDEPRTVLRFLTRSEGRIRLLFALEPGPLEGAELASSTGLPWSTLRRLLDEFRRRRLLAVEGDRLVLAPQGMALARRLGETVDSIASMQRLQRRARELSLAGCFDASTAPVRSTVCATLDTYRRHAEPFP